MEPPSQPQQPWHLDATLYPQLVQALSQEKKRFYTIPGTQKDWEQVQRLYSKNPTSDGLVIAQVEVVYNQAMLEGFIARLQELEERGGKNAFQANWLNEPQKLAREDVHSTLQGKLLPLAGFQYAKVVSMFHGTISSLIPSILSTNFANLAETDVGYFGKGIYHSSHARYADLYARFAAMKSQSEPRLFYNLVSFFSAYPVIHGDMSELEAKGNKGNYDAHFALVAPATARDDDINCYPIKIGQQARYDELVVFQSHQVLPRYIVTLGPSGIVVKQISVVHSVADLLEALTRYRQHPEGTLYLQICLQRMQERLQTENPATLLTEEQNWLLAHVCCLNPKCDPAFKSQVKARLLVYFHEKDPQERSEERIIATLRKLHLSKNTIPGLLEGVALIEESYTELVIVQQEKKQSEEAAFQDLRIHSWENIEGSKKPIFIDNLFVGEEAKELSHVLLVGRAGVGKSTLCRYISYQWGTGKLWNQRFNAVICMTLRTLKSFTGEGAAQFIFEQCIPRSEKGIHLFELTTFLQQNKEKVLFILDGYDEAQFALGSKEAKVLQELMDYPCWLLTSRPYAVHGIQADRTVESVGFSQERVHEYLSKVLSANGAQSLRTQLQTNPWLAGISHIPLNLALICDLFKTQGGPTFESMTSLYKRFTLKLQGRFLQKTGLSGSSELEEGDFEKIDPLFAQAMHLIEEVAWHGLETQNLLISFRNQEIEPLYRAHRPSELAQRGQFNQLIKEIGFLQSTGSHAQFLDDTYYFAHLTFQEFFAARYICRLLKMNSGEAKALIQSQKFNPQFQVVFWFIAGLLKGQKGQPEQLKLFFDLLDSPKDLVGFYTFQLRTRCLEECGWPDDLEKKEEYRREALAWCGWSFNPILSRLVKETLVQLLRVSPKFSAQLASQLRQELEGDNDFIASTTAGTSLATAGPIVAKELVNPLLQILHKDKNSDAYGRAIRALDEISATSLTAIMPLLLQSLNDVNESVRRVAITQLQRIIQLCPERTKEITPFLLQALEDKNGYNLLTVVRILSHVHLTVEDAEKCVQLFLQAREDEDFNSSHQEASVIANLAKQSPESASKVTLLLLKTMMNKAQNVKARGIAALALGNIIAIFPKNAKETLEALQEILKDKDATVRCRAVDSLTSIVEAMPESVQEIFLMLLEAFEDEDLMVKRGVMGALARIVMISPQKAKEVVPLLLQVLESRESHISSTWSIHGGAVMELGHIAEVSPTIAEEMISPILNALNSKNLFTKRAVLASLLTIARKSPEHAMKFSLRFLQLLKSSERNDLKNRALAVSGLRVLVNLSPEIANKILSFCLRTWKQEGFSETIWRFLMIVCHSPESLKKISQPFLRVVKKNKYKAIDDQAYRKIAEILPEHILEVLPSLLSVLKEGDEYYRVRAAYELVKIAEKSPKCMQGVLSSIQQALEDENASKDVKLSMLEILNRTMKAVPTTAIEALPSLLKSRKNQHATVRQGATEGLALALNRLPGSALEAIQETLLAMHAEIFFAPRCEEILRAISLTPTLLQAAIKAPSIAQEIPFLWIVITKCIHENIPLFIVSNRLCFYKNGLQHIEIADVTRVANLFSLACQNYVTDTLKGYIQILDEKIVRNSEEEALLGHIKSLLMSNSIN